ncbi:MAG: hypothetical protein ACRC62_36455, partial [Microcoleus sp.]
MSIAKEADKIYQLSTIDRSRARTLALQLLIDRERGRSHYNYQLFYMSTSPVVHKVIGVAVIKNDREQFLIDKRSPQGLHGGFWEFPGGKV